MITKKVLMIFNKACRVIHSPNKNINILSAECRAASKKKFEVKKK